MAAEETRMIQSALQCCKLGDRFVEDPVPRFSSTGAGTSAATAPASAPNRNPEKELGDVGQQPQRRPGGSSLHGCASRPIATFISIKPRRLGASFRERRSACMVAVTARCTQGFGIGEVLEGLAQSHRRAASALQRQRHSRPAWPTIRWKLVEADL